MSTLKINLGNGKQIVGGKVVAVPTNPDNSANKPKPKSQKPQAPKPSNLTQAANSHHYSNPTVQLATPSIHSSMPRLIPNNLTTKLSSALNLIEANISPSWHIIDGKPFIFYQQNRTNLCVVCAVMNLFQIQSFTQLKEYLSTTDQAYQQKLATCLQNAIKNGVNKVEEIDAIRNLAEYLKEKHPINNTSGYYIYVLDGNKNYYHGLCAVVNQETCIVLDSAEKEIIVCPNLQNIIFSSIIYPVIQTNTHYFHLPSDSFRQKWTSRNNRSLGIEAAY